MGNEYSGLQKEYGPHKYPGDGWTTHDCEHGCGCWAGPTNSGGPIGLVTIGGECPNNPKDGQRLGGSEDHRAVVNRALHWYRGRMNKAEEELKGVAPGARKLLAQLTETRRALFRAEQQIEKAREALTPASRPRKKGSK